ncbi:MAG: hypothetical protein AAF667_04750 [Pseudomonadota bacterium]
MLDAAETDDLLTRLRDLCATGGLPKDVRTGASQLLERLEAPVRIAIFGMPGVGKSTVLNLLAGGRILDPTLELPTTEVTHGKQARTMATLPDGGEHVTNGLPDADLLAMEPAFLRVETPLERLRSISLLEVVAEESLRDQRAALTWASKRADIALWCTHSFHDAEQRLWISAPDRLKDHSFLLLTRADEFAAAGNLRQRLDTLAETGSHEFYSIMPLAAEQALAAIMDADTQGANALGVSGGQALLDAIDAEMTQGRRGDLDSALMLLSRFEPVASAGGATITHIEDARATAEAEKTRLDPADKQTLHSVLERIEAVSADIAGGDDTGAEELVSTILERASGLAEELAEELVENGGRAEAVQSLAEDFQDASEMLLLMQLENAAGPAADAACLLLQLRREVEQVLAA